MDPVLMIRNHAFATFHDRVCSTYSRLVPRRYRSSLEHGLLSFAVVFIAIWVYVHLTFFKLAGNCFDHLSLTTLPPPDHIVQVEMFWNSSTVWQTVTQTIVELEEEIVDLQSRTDDLLQDNISSYDGDQVPGIGNRGRDRAESAATDTLSPNVTSPEADDDDDDDGGASTETVNLEEDGADQQEDGSSAEEVEGLDQCDSPPGLECDATLDATEVGRAHVEDETTLRGYQADKVLLDQMDIDSLLSIAPEYILLEFSQKSGYLGLSKADRERFNISGTVYTLDLNNVTCFGGTFGKMLHYSCLGFETTLINSYRYLMHNDSSRAFVRNVLSGSYYYLKIAWLGRTRYIVGVMPLVFFTMIASAFVRQSQYQLFKLLFVFRQMVMQEDMPFAMSAIGHMPLLTITYACVGLVVVMSEVLADSGLFCMTMLITVWVADQYYAIFCNTPTSKKYWPKFFYLYHFIPYAFFVRMNGIYWMFPFLAHWCLLQHSMLYFFHRYELPLYEARHPRAHIIDLNEFGIHVVAFVQQNPVMEWLQYHLDRMVEHEEEEGGFRPPQQQQGDAAMEEAIREGGRGEEGTGTAMNDSFEEEEEQGGREASRSRAGAVTANQLQERAASLRGDQQDGQWYSNTNMEFSDEEQGAADDSVGVRPCHHSSRRGQDSTTCSTIDSDHSSPLSTSLSRRSLH